MVRTELPPQATIREVRTLEPRRQNFIENPFEALTPREKEILSLIAQGLSNNKIGTNLTISPRTAECHIGNICGKLHVDSEGPQKKARVEVAIKYIDQNPDFKNPFDNRKTYKPFTAREKEVLNLIGQGLTDNAIAKKLFLEERTVENHVHNILEKIGIDHKEQSPRVVMMLVSKAKLNTPTK